MMLIPKLMINEELEKQNFVSVICTQTSYSMYSMSYDVIWKVKYYNLSIKVVFYYV